MARICSLSGACVLTDITLQDSCLSQTCPWWPGFGFVDYIRIMVEVVLHTTSHGGIAAAVCLCVFDSRRITGPSSTLREVKGSRHCMAALCCFGWPLFCFVIAASRRVICTCIHPMLY